MFNQERAKGEMDSFLMGSQEIWDHIPIGHHSRGLSHSVENVKGTLQFVINIQNGGHIAAPVTIIGGRPHSHQVLVLVPIFEPIHNQLVSTSNKLNVINMVEFRGHFGSK